MQSIRIDQDSNLLNMNIRAYDHQNLS